MNEIDSEDEDVKDEHGDEGNSDEEQAKDFVEKCQEAVRRLMGTNYLLTKAELTLDLDSDEEFAELNRGQGAFSTLEEDVQCIAYTHHQYYQIPTGLPPSALFTAR